MQLGCGEGIDCRGDRPPARRRPARVASTENKKRLATLKDLTKELMRRQIIDNVRVDGRKLDEVARFCRVGILPKRVHGTGLLTGD